MENWVLLFYEFIRGIAVFNIWKLNYGIHPPFIFKKLKKKWIKEKCKKATKQEKVNVKHWMNSMKLVHVKDRMVKIYRVQILDYSFLFFVFPFPIFLFCLKIILSIFVFWPLHKKKNSIITQNFSLLIFNT